MWLSEFDNLPTGSALDLGAGAGGDAIWLAEQGYVVTALDQADRMKPAAKQVVSRFETRDMRQPLPFDDQCFDLVVASLSLHYFADDDLSPILAEIQRVMAPGGRLVARLNRVGDTNYGYGHPFELIKKRFFDEQAVKASFGGHFLLTDMRATTSDDYIRGPKQIIEFMGQPL